MVEHRLPGHQEDVSRQKRNAVAQVLEAYDAFITLRFGPIASTLEYGASAKAIGLSGDTV